MEFKLTDQEKSVCRILQCAISNRHGVCDINDLSDKDEEAILSLEKKGYLQNDVNCIILKKEFKKFLEKECSEVGS